MTKVLKYTLYDLIRNRWLLIYMSFFLIVTVALIGLSNDSAKVLISLSNITLVLTPLVGILFGVMYYYSSEDFIRFLLAQPLSRGSIISGILSGISLSLIISLAVGIGLPMLFHGILSSPDLKIFIIVLGMAMILSIIYVLLAFVITLNSTDRIRGFGIAIFTWLFFSVIYDGLFLLLLLIFKDYPLENLTLGLTILNPIDLARNLTLINLDISAMMGYTGAVLKDFFGRTSGSIVILVALCAWLVIPFVWIKRTMNRKDF